jgi:hypothetical protein
LVISRYIQKYCCCILLLLVTALTSSAQIVPDTARIPLSLDTTTAAQAPARAPLVYTPETTATKKEPFQPIPKKSGLYSAILPGAGQLYNRQYWKIPVIYAGVAAAGYFMIDNSKQYRKYRRIYIARLQNDFSDGLPYQTAEIKTLQDAYKKYLDMTVLLTALGYTIQVLDAVTFAHLKNFDVSKDISMRMSPVVTPGGIGLGLVVHFK